MDWNQVGDWKFSDRASAGRAIVPIRRKEPSGTLEFFMERIKPDPGPMSDETVIAAYTSSRELVRKVTETPGGIGFVGEMVTHWSPGLKRVQVYDDSKRMIDDSGRGGLPGQ